MCPDTDIVNLNPRLLMVECHIYWDWDFIGCGLECRYLKLIKLVYYVIVQGGMGLKVLSN